MDDDAQEYALYWGWWTGFRKCNIFFAAFAKSLKLTYFGTEHLGQLLLVLAILIAISYQ